MRVAINGSNRDDVLGLRLEEFRDQLKRMDRKIEQLMEGITSMKAGNGE